MEKKVKGEKTHKILKGIPETHEKNKYLTIFESIPNPVILLNRENKIDNMNFAAVNLFRKNLSPGSQYYSISKDSLHEHSSGIQLFEILPWLKKEVEEFHEKNLESLMFEKPVLQDDTNMVFRVKLSKIPG